MRIYYYKDKPYEVLSDTSIKIGDEWIPGIIYICLYENKDGMVWVRTKEEFNKLFKEDGKSSSE